MTRDDRDQRRKPPQWGGAENQPQRVLVVEDEDSARFAISNTLRKFGFEVVAVGSGEEAEDLTMEPCFDLLVCDIVLPDVSGAVLAKRLPDRWPGLKIILMSGYTREDLVRKQIADDTVRFLPKPFGADALKDEIDAVYMGPNAEDGG